LFGCKPGEWCEHTCMENHPTSFVPAATIASRTGLPRAWIRRAAADGTIPSIRAGKQTLFDPVAVASALDRQQQPKPVELWGSGSIAVALKVQHTEVERVLRNCPSIKPFAVHARQRLFDRAAVDAIRKVLQKGATNAAQ
jgi:hypothetical protein